MLKTEHMNVLRVFLHITTIVSGVLFFVCAFMGIIIPQCLFASIGMLCYIAILIMDRLVCDIDRQCIDILCIAVWLFCLVTRIEQI